jgi:biopolymer transport protein ExbD
MAGIDVGGRHGSKRALNMEIPLIPFIDFLLCLVAFLLVTAVWSQMARLNADARVPGQKDNEPVEHKPEKELHIEMRGESRFQLVWKEGATVVSTVEVDRKRVNSGAEGDYQYPALAEKVEQEWKSQGSHRSMSDEKFDRAVLHTDNTSPFADVIAVIDAVHAAKREVNVGHKVDKFPAFNVTFAVN